MAPDELNRRLKAAIESNDFVSSSDDLVQDLNASGSSIEDVATILHFIERNSDVDFGAPGPLVHFVEKFYRRGYEDELLKSVSRKPTTHTVWMLNRVINGTRDSGERSRLINILRSSSESPNVDEQTKRVAAHFLGRLVGEQR